MTDHLRPDSPVLSGPARAPTAIAPVQGEDVGLGFIKTSVGGDGGGASGVDGGAGGGGEP